MSKSRLHTQYSFANVLSVINGRKIEGYWEGDNAIEITERSPVSNPMVGADGAAIISITTDQSVEVILRLQGNSPTHEYLNMMLLDMKDGNTDPMSMSVRDTRNGEGGSSSQVTITQNSAKTFGVNAGVREWRLFANNWEWNNQAYLTAPAA